VEAHEWAGLVFIGKERDMKIGRAIREYEIVPLDVPDLIPVDEPEPIPVNNPEPVKEPVKVP